jgi:hypothetical protein
MRFDGKNVPPPLYADELLAHIAKRQPGLKDAKIIGFHVGKRDWKLELEILDGYVTLEGNIARALKLLEEAKAA